MEYSNSCANIGVKSHSAKEIRYFGSVDNDEFATLILKEKDYDRELTVRVCSVCALLYSLFFFFYCLFFISPSALESGFEIS